MIGLPRLSILWDLESDPTGNVQHISEHGITPEEVEEVLCNVEVLDKSRSTGADLAIGFTDAGRALIVVFEEVDDGAIDPITAYELEE